MKFKELIKSYSFWTALAGALVVFVGTLGEIFGFAVKDSIINDIVMGIAGILVVFGIVTMPISKEVQENNNKKETDICEENKAKADDKQKEEN